MAEQARISFLQTELCAAQARIVQLDASVKDKDQRVSVLMARIKIFEDDHTKSMHEKYFPSQEPPSAANQSTKPAAPPQTKNICRVHPTPQCMCYPPLPPSCCHPQYQSQCTCQTHSHHQLPAQADLLSSIESLRIQVNDLTEVTRNIQTELNNLGTDQTVAVAPPNTAVPSNVVDTEPERSNPETETMPDNRTEKASSHMLNDSVASFEEFITDDIEPAHNSLNFQFLTTQL